MNTTSENFTDSPTKICPACGANELSVSTEPDSFEYGERDSTPVLLTVMVPVHHCSSCGLSFTEEDASVLRHEAICKHLGVMNPQEIRAIREHYDLSQADFSEITNIGKASIARWEGGLLIQNQANDNLLYLLTFKENMDRLRQRKTTAIVAENSCGNVIQFRPRFRAIKETQLSRLEAEAKDFKLYPTAAVG